MNSIKLLIIFTISSLLFTACGENKKNPNELNFQEAHKKLLLLGVDVKVDFDSFENIKVQDQFQEVPCVKIQKYQFFAVTETPKFISDIIEALNDLKRAIKREIDDEDYGFCLTEGYSLDEIIKELQSCKQVIESGGGCF